MVSPSCDAETRLGIGLGASQTLQAVHDSGLCNVHCPQDQKPGGGTAPGPELRAAIRASPMPSSAVKTSRVMLSDAPQKRPQTADTAALSSSRSASPMPRVLINPRRSVARVRTKEGPAQKSNQPVESSTRSGDTASCMWPRDEPAMPISRVNSPASAMWLWPATDGHLTSTSSSTATSLRKRVALSSSFKSPGSNQPC